MSLADDAGPEIAPGEAGGQPDLVRPFIVTRGRTRSQRSDIRVETLIQTSEDLGGAERSIAEERAVLYVAAGEPKSVAEISAHTGLPLGVVTILVGDLVDEGAIQLHQTDPVDIEVSALTRMIERVRAL